MVSCPFDPYGLAHCCPFDPWAGTRNAETVGRISSIRSAKELHRFVVVQHHGHLSICPFVPYALVHRPECISVTAVLWTCLNMVAHLTHGSQCMSLKPLDWFSSSEILWNCLRLVRCNAMGICPFDPYELAHGSDYMKLHAGWIFSVLNSMESSLLVVVCPFDPYGLAPCCRLDP